MATHTPGPWIIAPGPQIVRVGSDNGISVALVSRLRDEYEANARLIAAAPDLLAACEMALDLMTEYGGACACGRGIDLRDICRAAIAKARA